MPDEVKITDSDEKLMVSMTGKTVKEVIIGRTWSAGEAETLLILFTDGTAIELGARSESGCEECDSEGANCETLYANDYKPHEPFIQERRERSRESLERHRKE